MVRSRNLFNIPSTIAVVLLCVIIATIVYFWDKERVLERASKADSIWTVTLTGRTSSYTFRGPLNMFLIHKSLVTSLRNRTASVTSLSMEWHYKSGKPWVEWAKDNPAIGSAKDEIELSARVSTIRSDLDINIAAIAKKIHLDNSLKRANPEARAKVSGKVWGNTAIKYRDHAEDIYLIEERKPYDGRVITCGDTHKYCTLYGARVNDDLTLEHIRVWKADVVNWRQYQDKARSLAEQYMLDRP